MVSLQAIVRAHCVHEGVDCSIGLKECEVCVQVVSKRLHQRRDAVSTAQIGVGGAERMHACIRPASQRIDEYEESKLLAWRA